MTKREKEEGCVHSLKPTSWGEKNRIQNIKYINKCFKNTKGCGDVNPNSDNSGSSPKVRPL